MSAFLGEKSSDQAMRQAANRTIVVRGVLVKKLDLAGVPCLNPN
jgi:hypothetical protein